MTIEYGSYIQRVGIGRQGGYSSFSVKDISESYQDFIHKFMKFYGRCK